MAHFKYIARDQSGKRVTGSQEAPEPNVLLERLTQKGYVVTKIEPVNETGQSSWLKMSFGGGKKISEEQFIFFNLQLANMIESGLTLISSLDNIIKQVKNPSFRGVLRKVTSSIEEGKSFSEATSQFPKVFPELFTSLMFAGEASGTLDMILQRYAKMVEDQFELKKKVKSAMTYPIILITVSVGVVVLMITLVVPNFVAIFVKSGVPLPWPTQFLYGLSMGARKYWFVSILICILPFAVVGFLKTTVWGKKAFDTFKLRVPLFGSLTRKVIMSRWARTLGTLIGGGLPILQALVISKKVAQNVVIEHGIEQACEAVERGGRIGDTFREDKEFPIEVVQMISVGEESGTIDKMLIKVAEFYDKIISYQVKRLSELIEPAFLVVVGAIVAFIMISILLPIFDMMKAIQGGGFK